MFDGQSPVSPNQPPTPAQPRGYVFSVSGAQAGVRLRTKCESAAEDSRPATVGSFLGIRRGKLLIIGLITHISFPTGLGAAELNDYAMSQLDLLGEIKQDESGRAYFQRGITEYPVLGDSARLATAEELKLLVEAPSSNRIMIGHLLQDSSIPVFVRIEEMLRKHFAVFGATGVGKSNGVALILRGLLEARPELRIFLFDPHNEYSDCFDDRARVLNPRNLKLPFWLFNFEEMINVLFRGRSDLADEVEILSDMIPIAKTLFAQRMSAAQAGARRSESRSDNNYTVDTPVPYRVQDLVELISERMGKLENLSTRMRYHRLIRRIETVVKDPRYGFMFNSANIGGDIMVEVLGHLFRLPSEGKPVTVMQLSGFPAEIVDSVVSVVCRMAFDFGLWSDGSAPLLVVCEEAHRYAPAEHALGFEPTRKAVARIAKEGRKYGVYLGLVTQRPAELDSTIISQCSTLFAMRLANERDQAIVRAAVSDAAASQLSFVPALGTGEVIAFGEGVALPIRLRFDQLPEEVSPRAKSGGRARFDAGQSFDKEFTEAVVDRWRGAMDSKKPRSGDELDVVEAAAVKGFVNGSENSRDSHERTGHAVAGESPVQLDPVPARSDQGDRPGILRKTPVRGLSEDLQELRDRLRNRRSQQ
jgi:uncharacterized protein